MTDSTPNELGLTIKYDLADIYIFNFKGEEKEKGHLKKLITSVKA